MKGETKDETGNRNSADEKKEAWKQRKKERKDERKKKARRKESIYNKRGQLAQYDYKVPGEMTVSDKVAPEETSEAKYEKVCTA